MVDWVFRDVQVLDGTGSPGYRADVAVEGDTIVTIGRELPAADREVSGAGRMLAPGFVDLHTHSDFSLVTDPRGESKVRQGVTTEVIGNCGGWAAPLARESLVTAETEYRAVGGTPPVPWRSMAEYLEVLQRQGIGLNVAALVGHGTLRGAVMGFEGRPPTPDEQQAMEQHLRVSLEAGVMGMSTGLYYAPGSYADTDEIVALCRILAAHDALHTSHIRDESTYSIGLMASIEEVLDVGRQSGVRTQISHLKALGPELWGRAPELLDALWRARQEGLDVMADQYPYVASGSSITGALIPRWAQEGGRKALVARIESEAVRNRLLDDVRDNLRRRGGPERLQIARFEPAPDYEGLTLAQVAEQRKETPEVTALELLRDADAAFVCFVMDEADVDRIMANEWVMVASDGRAVAVDGPTASGHPHPRYYGTFPRVLGRYTRERGILTWEQAVQKMTSMPALRLGLTDRGFIKPGYRADLVLFDPEQVMDRATFDNPKQYPVGIDAVMVNGRFVLENGGRTDERPGRVLRRA